MFWENQDELLSASEEDLPGILSNIVAVSRAISSDGQGTALQPTPVNRVGGLISIASAYAGRPAASAENSGVSKHVIRPCIVIYEVTKAEADGEACERRICEEAADPPMVLLINVVSNSKDGPCSFKGNMRRCMDFAAYHLRENRPVCFACESGKDLSVGMAVAALQSFFDDSGALDCDNRQKTGEPSIITSSYHIFTQLL